MKNLSNRVVSFTESVIRKMTFTTNRCNLTNLVRRFSKLDPLAETLNRLQEASPIDPHQYPIACGAKSLREVIARKHEKLTGNTTNPGENVVIIYGGTEAMMASMMVITNLGDKAIILSLSYENYKADTILSGVDPIFIKLNLSSFDFNINEPENVPK